MAGRRVRCKHCGTTFQLPAEPTSADPFEQAADAGAPVPASVSLLDDDVDQRRAQHAPQSVPPNATRPTPEIAPPFGDAPYDPDLDVDSVFQDAFQEFSPSRGNTPFVFPGSRQLDRWLSHVIVVICVAWLAYLTLSPRLEDPEPTWVGPVRLLVLLLTYAGVVFPICLKGVRMAARKLNYDLPSGTPWRAFSTFLLPVTIGCAVWLSSGSVPGFIFGVAMGLIVAMPVMWLLFRIRTDDAPTSLGYGAGAFGAGLLASAFILFMLNLILVGVIRGSKAEHTLSISPFGPGFSWDGPTVVTAEKSRLATGPKRGEPAAPTTNKAFANLPDEDAPAKPGIDTSTQPVAVVAPLPETVDSATLKAVEDQQAKPAEAGETDLTAKAHVVKEAEHGRIVREVIERLSGEMLGIVHPILAGRAVAVVKDGERANENRIEVWSDKDWKPQKAVTFANVAHTSDLYALSSDGSLLARVAEFPHPSIQVYSFSDETLVRPFIKIDPRQFRPKIAGFITPEQVVLLFANGQQSSVEVWDVSKVRRLRRIEVPGLQNTPGNYTFSRDGKRLAVIVRDDVGGASTGRLEVYNLVAGSLSRRITIDELEWNAGVNPSGLAFNEEANKVAVLFEQQGQGLFLCWGGNNDIPIHQHVYPGGLLPVGVNVGAFRGPSFALVDDGRAWLLYGASVFDTRTGKLLGDLGIKDVRSQRIISPDTVLLEQQPSNGQTVLLEVRLDVDRARRELASQR